MSNNSKVESISLKTEFVTLESARLQKHKLMTLNSATKSSILSDSRSREGNPFYFLATQEDNIKEPNIENIKVYHQILILFTSFRPDKRRFKIKIQPSMPSRKKVMRTF